MRTVTLTCRTPGCENLDVPIDLDVPDDVDAFACGACGGSIAAPSQGTP